MTDYQKLLIPEDDGTSKHLTNNTIPNISLPNQEGNPLQLNRADTFRIILYFFPMTGRPDRPLPENWNLIPGAKGCTMQISKFRDNYDALIGLNAIPIGISTQSINDNKEMMEDKTLRRIVSATRLHLPPDAEEAPLLLLLL